MRGYWKITESLEVVIMRRTKIPRKVCLEKVSSVHLEFFFRLTGGRSFLVLNVTFKLCLAFNYS